MDTAMRPSCGRLSFLSSCLITSCLVSSRLLFYFLASSHLLFKIISPLVSRYVHHLTEEMKELLRVSGVRVPLLSPSHHGAGVCAGLTDQAGEGVCGSYQEQVQ